MAAVEGDYGVEVVVFHGLEKAQSATWSSEQWHVWLGETVDGHVPDIYEITTTWLKHGNECSITELKKCDNAASEKDSKNDWIPPRAEKKTVKVSAAITCPLN